MNIPKINVNLSKIPPLNSEQAATIAVALQNDSTANDVMPAKEIVPAYTITCADVTFIQGQEYTLSVLRDTTPSRQTQIEVECTGGTASPAFLVDEGEPYTFDNQKILVTPTEKSCRVTLKCTVNNIEYSVGKYQFTATPQQ